MNVDELAELRAKVYFDQDVDIRLAAMIRSKGFDVLTTLEAGRLGAQDDSQLEFAAHTGRAIVTHNRSDFERLHFDYFNANRQHSGIMIAVVRRNLARSIERLLEMLDRHDRDQLQNSLHYL